MRKCQNCINRLICPVYKKDNCCDGYNKESKFRGLLKMMFVGYELDEFIDLRLDFVKDLQKRKIK